MFFLVFTYALSFAGITYIVLSWLGKTRKLEVGEGARQIFVGVAAISTALAIPLTVYDILCHVFYYVNPLQRHYVRVLWMVIINVSSLFLPLLHQALESIWKPPVQRMRPSQCTASTGCA
jgi:hypothetical protein